MGPAGDADLSGVETEIDAIAASSCFRVSRRCTPTSLVTTPLQTSPRTYSSCTWPTASLR